MKTRQECSMGYMMCCLLGEADFVWVALNLKLFVKTIGQYLG